jgi:hypothetical protein
VAAFSQPTGKELLFEHPVNHPIQVNNLRALRTIGGIKIVVAKSRLAFLEMAIGIDNSRFYGGSNRCKFPSGELSPGRLSAQSSAAEN